MTNQEIFEMADKFKAAKDRRKEFNAQFKEVTAEIEELDLALSDAMAEILEYKLPERKVKLVQGEDIFK